MKLEIPFKTYASIFLAIAVAMLLIQLRFEIILLFIALIIAMTLYSAEMYLARRGVNKKVSTPLIIILYVGAFIAIVFWIIPAVVAQLMDMATHFTTIKSQVMDNQTSHTVEKNIRELLNGSPEILTSAKAWLANIGRQTLSGVFDIGILFIVSLYMFLDGPRSFRWVRDRFSPPVQVKLNKTLSEIKPIMTAYVFGQATTSTIAAIITYITARALHIPAAITLAFLAAVFDILPGIGLILLIIAASLMALAVSVKAAIIISVVLVAYHMIESYLLTPYIYGRQLKLSSLVVLLSLILAATIAGVAGMVAILPVVAAYTTIEKLWLKNENLHSDVES